MKRDIKEVLMRCSFWQDSIKHARNLIESKHGDFAELVKKSEFKCEKENGSFIIHMNSEARILWNLYDDVDKLAEGFVGGKMNLDRNTFLFHDFVTLWKEYSFPEAMQNNDDNAEETIVESRSRKNRKIWAERKIIRENGECRIIDSVHWYNGSIDMENVAKLILKAKWSKVVESAVKKAKGGRPRLPESSVLYTQAVICAILKEQEKLSNKEIASKFGWKIQQDSYGNANICNTVSHRKKLGRKIIGKKREVPTKN